MSGRTKVKIKSKVVKATLENKDVLDMFHGVLGTSSSSGAAALAITHPKYLRIQGHVERFLKLLTVFQESTVLNLFPGPKEHLGRYVGALKEQFATSFSAPDLTAHFPAQPLAPGPDGKLSVEDAIAQTEGYSHVPPEVVSQFTQVFDTVKKCSLVNTVLVTCKNLITHKKSLETSTALKDRFLLKDGMTLCPLPGLTAVNFKQIYIDDRLSKPDKEYVLVVLHKMYTIGHDVYEAVSAPDVDVNEFVEVIMSSISEVKRNIPRCDQAFDKIIESVDLLRGNFDGYYKDYVASNNPTIMMENFVIDVSKKTKSSPAVTKQFRTIIMHYRKLASQQASHPKLQSLFRQVDANFQELESKSKEADKADEDDSSDDEPPTPEGGKSSKQKAAEASATLTDDAGPAETDGAEPAETGGAPAAAAEPKLDAEASFAADFGALSVRGAGPPKRVTRNRRRRAGTSRRPVGRAGAAPGPQESLADEFDRDDAAEAVAPPCGATEDADEGAGAQHAAEESTLE